MTQPDHVCGLDDESVQFDPEVLWGEINEEWMSFLTRVWDLCFIPNLNDILSHYGPYVCLRQHESLMKKNFFILFRYIYKIIRNRMEPSEEQSAIVVDLHKLSGAGLFATLYLGPLALSKIARHDLESQKNDIIAKGFLRDVSKIPTESDDACIAIGAKYANELLAFRVGCGIALTELRYRMRIATEIISQNLQDNQSITQEEWDELSALGGSNSVVNNMKSLEMPENYEKHLLRALSQSYFTGCFDIVLWPHIFYWLQLYTLTPQQARKPIDTFLKVMNSGV